MNGFAASLALGAIILLHSSCASSLMFHPDRSIAATPERAGLPFQEVWFTAADGVRLNGWWVPAKDPRYTLLFSHGNGGNISHRLDSIMIFHRLGLNVFIYDYRGYGLSGGSPSEEGTYLDVEAAWNYLVKERGLHPGSMIIFGRSLGGAVACHAAVKYSPAMAILESTFTSAADVANHHYPFLPGRLIMGNAYNSIGKIGGLRCPLLVVHSRDDEVIPYGQGERLFRAAPGEKRFLEIAGSHNGGFMQSSERYAEGLREFIRRGNQRER